MQSVSSITPSVRAEKKAQRRHTAAAMQTTVLSMLVIAAVESSLIKEYTYISSRKSSWDEAHLYCKANSTELAFMDGEPDQDDLLKAAEHQNFEYAWIGLHREPMNYTGWKWTRAENPVTYDNWDEGQPDRSELYETKAAANPEGKWFDLKETGPFPFFCVNVFGVQETQKSWEEALQHCRDAGSDLVSLQSRHTANPTGGPLWIGLRFLAGHWLWVSGLSQPLDPQCPATTRCGALSAKGVWEARDCQEKLGFICNNPLR